MPWQAWQTSLTRGSAALGSAASQMAAEHIAHNASSNRRTALIIGLLFAGGPGGGAGVISREVGDILVRQRSRNGAHRRMAASPASVFLQRLGEVRLVLAAELGHLVNLGKRRPPTRYAGAADAHLPLRRAGSRVAR